ncbi:MAG: MSMEG_0565 family glycosyltransferase [Phormidesmis sp.]
MSSKKSCDKSFYKSLDKSLKIALLTYATKPRGSVIHTLELANALYEQGHHPHVFALDKDGRGFHRLADFETIAVPAGPCSGDIDQLIKQRIDEFVCYFQQHFPLYDIYHAQDCLSANALAILREQGCIPHFVRTVHHIESFRSPYLQDCQQRSIYLPDRCCCVSQLWQQVLAVDYGINAHRVMNGVSERFSAEEDGLEEGLKGELNIRGYPVYLTVGGIEPRKNSIRLLEAFAQVKVQQPEAQLVIAGGATLFDYQDYRDRFMQVLRSLGLENDLILPGVIADKHMPALYRLADGFVFPSVKEGWGLVVLEAIASGLPVVAADQPPFTEFLTEESAYLVDPMRVDAIAAAMIHMIGDDPKKGELDIVKTHSWQTSAQMHLELYEQLLEPVEA